MHRTASPDDRLVRRAGWTIAVQTGAAVALVVVIVVMIVYTVSLRARLEATETKVRDKVANAEQTGDGATDVIVDGLPAGCSVEDVASASAALGAGAHRIEVCETPFLLYVGARTDGTPLSAATSFIEQEEETRRLAWLSLLAGGVGVLAASGVGWLVGRRAVRPLATALRSQRRFVTDASHELRTPLTVLHTRAQLLARTETEDPQRAEDLEQLVADARDLGEVVTDMLLSAELQEGRQPSERVDLAAVAHRVCRTFAATATDRGVDLVVDAPPGQDVAITGVPTALRRAVSALVDNALAHVEQGGAITISLHAVDGAITLRVSDDGEGFDPLIVDDLRQRFARGTGSTDGTGTRVGLGLALVEEIVRAHGGTLELAARPRGGAAVSLVFGSSR